MGRLAVAALIVLSACAPEACHRGGRATRASDAALACGAPLATDKVESEMLVARLQELRTGGRDRVVYREPSDAEADAYRSFIRDVLSARPGDARVPAAPPGFMLERLPRDLLLVAEKPDSRRGAGAIVFRLAGPASDFVVEAPHTFFDMGTLPIAVAAFERTRGRALLINTVHRNRAREQNDPSDPGTTGSGDDEETGSSPSDLAHAARSFFLAAHEELAAAWPVAVTLQFHGFRDEIADGASVILSAAGTRSELETPAASLRNVLGADTVRVFPAQSRILGGVTNVEARVSAKLGGRFVHVEMSRSLRDRLTGDAALLSCFVDAFAEAFR